MAVQPYLVQRRMMELGRVRLGEKGPRGEPRKLTTLRFTSASKVLLDAIAVKHGGTVRAWEGAPEEGMYEVVTETAQIDIILPPVYSAQDGAPTTSYSQWFELWSGGGCQRRCDGETEAISGKPCMCNPDERDCKLTTRVSFMLPDIPGLGVWRLESHGYNAAVELPGTLEVLMLAAADHKFIPAVLRAEQRTKKVPGEGTRRFIVPVIELPGVTVNQLVSGDVPLAINAPVAANGERPALPPAPEPEANDFENKTTPAFGEPPALPGQDSPGHGPLPAADETGQEGETRVDAVTSPDPTITAAQGKKLNVLVGKLRENGHLSTENIYNAVAKKRAVTTPQLVNDTPGSWDGTDLHWGPLRNTLTKSEAHDLIERLTRLEANVASPFQAPAGVGAE